MKHSDLVIERNDLAKKELAGKISESEEIRLKELRRILTTPPPIFFTLPRVAIARFSYR
jgi:hypothetical protein